MNQRSPQQILNTHLSQTLYDCIRDLSFDIESQKESIDKNELAQTKKEIENLFKKLTPTHQASLCKSIINTYNPSLQLSFFNSYLKNTTHLDTYITHTPNNGLVSVPLFIYLYGENKKLFAYYVNKYKPDLNVSYSYETVDKEGKITSRKKNLLSSIIEKADHLGFRNDCISDFMPGLTLNDLKKIEFLEEPYYDTFWGYTRKEQNALRFALNRETFFNNLCNKKFAYIGYKIIYSSLFESNQMDVTMDYKKKYDAVFTKENKDKLNNIINSYFFQDFLSNLSKEIKTVTKKQDIMNLLKTKKNEMLDKLEVICYDYDRNDNFFLHKLSEVSTRDWSSVLSRSFDYDENNAISQALSLDSKLHSSASVNDRKFKI